MGPCVDLVGLRDDHEFDDEQTCLVKDFDATKVMFIADYNNKINVVDQRSFLECCEYGF